MDFAMIMTEWVNETKWNESTLNESKWDGSETKETERRNHSNDQSISQSNMSCTTRDKRGHCVWSLHRGLPRRPGPRSHRTDWRNNHSINQESNHESKQATNQWHTKINEWRNERMNDRTTQNEWDKVKWNADISEQIEFEWMKNAGQAEHENSWALRGSCSKTERRRTSEPMPSIAKIGCKLKYEVRKEIKKQVGR